jgi:hypothetical protein
MSSALGPAGRNARFGTRNDERRGDRLEFPDSDRIVTELCSPIARHEGRGRFLASFRALRLESLNLSFDARGALGLELGRVLGVEFGFLFVAEFLFRLELRVLGLEAFGFRRRAPADGSSAACVTAPGVTFGACASCSYVVNAALNRAQADGFSLDMNFLLFMPPPVATNWFSVSEVRPASCFPLR